MIMVIKILTSFCKKQKVAKELMAVLHILLVLYNICKHLPIYSHSKLLEDSDAARIIF